mmetsp:Transcript_75106/g.208883  ORF Transcript_75106/g.208883 Transcript_75106/m.208883 type:complete len:539 (-) Transcript_75106:246-1862(-)
MEPSRYVCAKPFAPVSRLGSYSSAPPALFTTAPCKACKAARAQLQSTSALPATRAIRPRSSDSKSLGVLVGVAAAACCSPRPQRGRSISSIVRCCDIESRSAKLRLLEELRAMRARDLKRRLQTLGLSTEGRVDKESLLELLERSDIDVLDATPSSRSGDEPGGGSSRSSSGSSSSRAADDVYSSAGAADRLQELRALRARDLRRELVSLGLNTQGCMDKQSLLELLETNAAFVLERTSCSAVSVPIHLLATQDQLGIQMEGRHITVDLVLGGLPYRFVMDTGASHTLIMQSMASALQAQDMGMPAWATGAMGTQSGMRLVSVPDAHLGPLSCSPLPLVLTPQSLPIPVGVAGIVGLDFIARFDWDIDVAAGQARVATAGSLPFSLAGMRQIPLKKFKAGGPDVLTVELQLWPGGRNASTSVKCMGVVDIGAVATLCNVAVAAALGLGPAELRDTGSVVAGFGGSPVRVQEASLRLAIGDGPDGPVSMETTVTVGDLPFFAQLGLQASGPVVLLGLDVLGRSRLVLSAETGRLWLPIV